MKERQRLRNQISAQNQRVKQKEESLFLNKVVKEKDSKFEQLIGYLAQILTQE